MVNWYCLCKRPEKTRYRILLWFPIVHSLWSMAYGILGFNWVVAGTVRYEIWAWKSISGWKKY